MILTASQFDGVILIINITSSIARNHSQKSSKIHIRKNVHNYSNTAEKLLAMRKYISFIFEHIIIDKIILCQHFSTFIFFWFQILNQCVVTGNNICFVLD